MRGIIDNDTFIVYDGNTVIYSAEVKSGRQFIYFNNIDDRYLPLLKQAIPAGTTLVAEYNDNLLKFGFTNPQMCENGICLYLSEDQQSEATHDVGKIRREYEFLSTQLASKYCEIILKISPTALTKMQRIIVENKDETKEIFGSFKIVDNRKEAGDIIHTIDIVDGSLKSGNTDDVSATPTIYNFHTHPISAYKMYKVKYGPPSVQDYKSIYLLCKNYQCIVHLVAALEGIYIVYLLPNITGSEKDVKRVITQNFKYDEKKTELSSYLAKINSLNIFKVDLRSWSDPNLTMGIRIQFRKSGKWGNCKIRD